MEIVIDIPTVPTSVSFLKDSQTIVVGTGNGNVQFWDSEMREQVCTIGHEAPSITGGVYDVEISSEGSLMAFCRDNRIEVWNISGRTCIAQHDNSASVISCIAFCPDTPQIAFGSYDKQVKLWEFNSGNLRTLNLDHRAIVTCLAFSRDGRLLATGSDDRTTKVSQLSSGEVSAVYIHPVPVKGVKFSAEDRTVVTSGFDSNIRFWDIATGLERTALRGHSCYVNCLSFSQDGTALVSAGWDNRVVLWQAASQSVVESGMEQHVHDFHPALEIMAEPIGE